MTAALRMPVLHGSQAATQRAREDAQVVQHNRQTAAAYAAFKRGRGR